MRAIKLALAPTPAIPPPAIGNEDDLYADLLVDCNNMSGEVLELVKSLKPFVFAHASVFLFEEYAHFLQNKKVGVFREATQQLANKVHGLKGLVGFVIPEAKRVCHQSENLIKPLAGATVVLDERLYDVLLQFVYRIQELLEAFERDPSTPVLVDDWINRLDTASRRAENFVAGSEDRLRALIEERSKDAGEVRRRTKDMYVSVSRDGYETLLSQVTDLYNVAVGTGQAEVLNKAGKLYNSILDNHQKIKKLPPDLSRYERLVPNIAEKYNARARFVLEDHGVLAEVDFWNGIHEICNHVVKNAVIHGIEPSVERVKRKKDETGTVVVELREDALSVYMSIRDDGRGLDGERIAAKAVENGLLTAEQARGLSHEERLRLIFAQGVSTREVLDDNAGRGIGLNAVQEAMKRLDGECRISSALGDGTTMDFTFAKSHVSLPCFVIEMGGDKLAVPEGSVIAYYTNDSVRDESIQGRPLFMHGNVLIPLLENLALFGGTAFQLNDDAALVMVLAVGEEACALRIDGVRDKSVLPIYPMPAVMGQHPIFIGTTLHEDRPLMVLRPSSLRKYF